MTAESLRAVFAEDQFKFDEVVFPGLNWNVKLSPNLSFRFDGIVPSLRDYVMSLSRDLRFWIKEIPQGAGGFNTAVGIGDYRGWLMAVQRVSPRVDVYNLAHESAEVLAGMGMYPLLKDYFDQNGLTLNPEHMLRHQIGVLAGFLTARNLGYDIAEMHREQDAEGYRLLQSLKLI